MYDRETRPGGRMHSADQVMMNGCRRREEISSTGAKYSVINYTKPILAEFVSRGSCSLSPEPMLQLKLETWIASYRSLQKAV